MPSPERVLAARESLDRATQGLLLGPHVVSFTVGIALDLRHDDELTRELVSREMQSCMSLHLLQAQRVTVGELDDRHHSLTPGVVWHSDDQDVLDARVSHEC